MDVALREVPLVFFEEQGVIIAHCVPLDVSSCGHTMEEAMCNIRDAVTGFIESCEDKGTLEQVLAESGFVKRGTSWQPPALLSVATFNVPA
ncbi:MAG TPA: type II toxin-antitoxin system HicB family antitoxin [Blastocatellia bacterium]|nr:type II toxin-antitoxin system HicB family antitoxin [Blastocatellia bacterium]